MYLRGSDIDLVCELRQRFTDNGWDGFTPLYWWAGDRPRVSCTVPEARGQRPEVLVVFRTAGEGTTYQSSDYAIVRITVDGETYTEAEGALPEWADALNMTATALLAHLGFPPSA